MAHGKETPRQKMIGMMYLVLTALLALNVSTSVLDAFKIIDEGLSKTQNTLYLKIQEVYSRFDQQVQLNPNRVTDWRDRAYMVRQRADTLYKHLQDLKLLVLREAEKSNYKAIFDENGELLRDNVKSVIDYDTPNRIMIGPDLNSNSRARILKNEINEYREFLLSFVPEENTKLRESIEGSLETDKPQDKGTIKSREETEWELHKFGHSPLMGFVAIMSSLQINVRNAESEVINYLYSRIDEGAIKFNELDATVIPNTNYVIRGNKYKAQVFIAARDTTSDPVVYVTESANPYKEVKDERGKIIDYQKRDDLTYRTLPIEGGKGIYEQTGAGTGFREWGGIIEIIGPSGPIRKPFKESYQVAESNVVVSPTKMNVFYYGVDNPVDISVAGVPADRISAINTNGVIRPRGGSWIVNPKRPGFSTIRVFADFDGQKKEVGFKEFRVKTVPDPVAMVADRKGGGIDKNLLLAATGVQAVMESFDFDLTLRVKEFTVLVVIQGFVTPASSNSARFTEKQKDLIGSLSRGAPLFIQDIKAVGPDGTVRPLNTISFKIN
jgi:gliding motility-associated protein GldM